jgi:hypothetical protein
MLVLLLWIIGISFPLQAADFAKFEIFSGYSFLGANVSANPGINSPQKYYYTFSENFFGELNSTLPLFHSLTNPSGLAKLSGFEVSGAYNINKWLGVEASFQRQTGEQIMDQTLNFLQYANDISSGTTVTNKPLETNNNVPIRPVTTPDPNTADGSNTSASGFGTAKLAHNTFLIGPRFSLRTNSRFTPFAHFQIGLSKIKKTDLKMTYSFSSEDNEYLADNTLSNQTTYSIKGNLAGNISNIGFAMSLGGGVDCKINKWLSLRLIQADYLMTRHGYNYNYTDKYVSDVSTSAYATVWLDTGSSTSGGGETYAPYTQITQKEVIYNGTRSFAYSVPNQFMNNLKISTGIVIKF